MYRCFDTLPNMSSTYNVPAGLARSTASPRNSNRWKPLRRAPVTSARSVRSSVRFPCTNMDHEGTYEGHQGPSGRRCAFNTSYMF